VKEYSTAKDEQFYIGYFADNKKKKLSNKDKLLREFHLHVDSHKIFVNVKLGGEVGLRKAIKDNIQMYYYPDQNGQLFVDMDWMIDKKIMGPSQTPKMVELKQQIIESNLSLLGGEVGSSNQ
jgi:hypothetical protein